MPFLSTPEAILENPKNSEIFYLLFNCIDFR